MRILVLGGIKFNSYNSTNQTGTPTYLLGTDASGNVVKTNTVPGSGAGPYLPLAGGTMTGTAGVLMPDNFRLKIGTSEDLLIFHDGTDSQIFNQIGDLKIRNDQNDGDIVFMSDNGSGGVATYFYLDGSLGLNRFLEDTLHNDDVVAKFGTGSDLRIQHSSGNNSSYIQNYTGDLIIENLADDKDIIFKSDDGSGGVTSYLVLDGSTTHAYFSNPGNVGIGTTAPDSPLEIEFAEDTGTTKEMLHLDYNPVDNYGSALFKISSGGSANNIFEIEQVTGGGAGDFGTYVDTNIINRNVSSGAYGNINFVTGSSTSASSIVMTIGGGTQKGNVGIGTTSPGVKLEVSNGSSGFTGSYNGRTASVFEGSNSAGTTISIMSPSTGYSGLFFGDENNEAEGQIQYDHSTNAFKFLNGGGSERMRITSGGNVGIGTTNPTSKLVIGDLANTSGVLNDIFVTGDKVNLDGYYARLIFGNSSQSGGSTASIRGERKTDNYGTELTFYTNTNGSSGSGTERMRIDDIGDVGIGTTINGYQLSLGSSGSGSIFALGKIFTAGNIQSSTGNITTLMVGSTAAVSSGVKLEVVGNMQASGATFQGTTSSLIALKTSGATLRANITGNNNGLELGVFGTKSINFEWDGVTKIQMKSTGEGIFAGKVSINNASNTDSILNIVDDGTNGNIAFENDSGDVVSIITSVADELNIRVGDGISMSDSIRLRLNDSGNMTIAGTLTQNSDVRLKENIKPIESALDKVKQMQGVEFNKINSSTKEIGVVAQEIEKIIPELVLEDKEGIKSVAYGNITAVLIEAIKEQQKQIEELKQQLNK